MSSKRVFSLCLSGLTLLSVHVFAASMAQSHVVEAKSKPASPQPPTKEMNQSVGNANTFNNSGLNEMVGSGTAEGSTFGVPNQKQIGTDPRAAAAIVQPNQTTPAGRAQTRGMNQSVGNANTFNNSGLNEMVGSGTAEGSTFGVPNQKQIGTDPRAAAAIVQPNQTTPAGRAQTRGMNQSVGNANTFNNSGLNEMVGSGTAEGSTFGVPSQRQVESQRIPSNPTIQGFQAAPQMSLQPPPPAGMYNMEPGNMNSSGNSLRPPQQMQLQPQAPAGMYNMEPGKINSGAPQYESER